MAKVPNKKAEMYYSVWVADWTTPKTNWKGTDRFELSDWTRVWNNFVHLYGLGRYKWSPKDADSALVEADYFMLCNIMDDMERNLGNLYWHKQYNESGQVTTSPLPVAPFSGFSWLPRLDPDYLRNPTFHDLNRWETFMLDLKGWLDLVVGQSNRVVSGTFYSGNNRLLQMLSRGR